MSLDTRNEELDKKIHDTDLPDAVATLIKDAKSRRRQIKWLVVSLVFDLVLSAVLAYGWSQNHNLAIKAETNKNAIIRNCETANESRKNQRQLWAYVISLTPTQPRTAEQQARTDEFQKFVNTTFAPRDCAVEAKDLK